jgi:putative SOS response-associated peptidase YedK
MCGKLTQIAQWSELVTFAELIVARQGPVETVTPMRFASIITSNEQGRRQALRMRWGMVAHTAQDPLAGTKHIHARAETVERLPTFRDAFANRRGLVVVATFNEGKEITPTKTEQHVITPRDGKPLGIAVVWERWTNRNDNELLTFAMVTTPANRLIGTITDRMPAVIAPEDWDKWLGEEPATVEEIKALLKPCEGDWDMRPQEKTARPPPRPTLQPDLF